MPGQLISVSSGNSGWRHSSGQLCNIDPQSCLAKPFAGTVEDLVAPEGKQKGEDLAVQERKRKGIN